MNLTFISAAVACLAIAGCASIDTTKPMQETPECMNYRGMMTAPMPPDAMERLRMGCEASRGQ